MIKNLEKECWRQDKISSQTHAEDLSIFGFFNQIKKHLFLKDTLFKYL
jgi:hypothetical protein